MTIPRRALLACAALVLLGAAPSSAQELAAECEYAPDGPSQLSVGVVDCLRFDSAMMGGVEPFSYYIPPACAPALGRQCPVFYFLHGLTGDYTVGLGVRGQADAHFVKALTSGPPLDPRPLADPWIFEDPSTWVPKAPMDLILVAPHGPTLEGGYGPSPDEPKDSGWQDFHPQYWEGGDSQVFDGPPPRAASMVTQELIPYVDAHFPVIAARSGRALGGISYGGVGTGHIGLRWPDLFSSLQLMSGIGLPWPPACVLDPGGNEVAAPIEFPLAIGSPGLQPLVESIVSPPLIFITQNGDGLSTDYAYTRQHHPPDLMTNARVFSGGDQVLRLAFSANDTIRFDPLDTPLYAVGAGLEHLVATETGPMADLETTQRGVEHTFELNAGLHLPNYWTPHYRVWLEEMYAVLEHWDGGGTALPDPEVFDYRSVFEDFTVWGWEFSIEREVEEFINLTDVSCDSLTLRGTGMVTVTVPASCGTGVGGSREVEVDLGPSIPTNEPAALGLCDSYGNTETVELFALDDLDGDGVGTGDNCPIAHNPGQEDDGGLESLVADGIGNACQCGDVTGNGVVDSADVAAIRMHGLGSTPEDFAVGGNCDVTGNGQCNGQDATAIQRAAQGLPSLFGQHCQNADPTAPPCENCP